MWSCKVHHLLSKRVPQKYSFTLSNAWLCLFIKTSEEDCFEEKHHPLSTQLHQPLFNSKRNHHHYLSRLLFHLNYKVLFKLKRDGNIVKNSLMSLIDITSFRSLIASLSPLIGIKATIYLSFTYIIIRHTLMKISSLVLQFRRCNLLSLFRYLP